MTKTARIMDIYRRLLKVHNSNIEDDEVVHSATIEAVHYNVSPDVIRGDIDKIRDCLFEIAVKDYEFQKRDHDDFYIEYLALEYSKKHGVYWLRNIAASKTDFEVYIARKDKERRLKEFKSLLKQYD